MQIQELLDRSGEPLCSSPPSLPKGLSEVLLSSADDLIGLLTAKNGFYAFQKALHVFPSSCPTASMDLERWNASVLWLGEYGEVTSRCLFFAEDLFGVQFAIQDGVVYRFDPEVGVLDPFAKNVESWAGRLVQDPEFETGYPLLLEWEKVNGRLPEGKRLLPKMPFVLGGEYSVENLYAADAVEGMKVRADIWRQIKNLPDGAQIRLKII